MESLLNEFSFFLLNLKIKDFVDLFFLWLIIFHVLRFADRSGVYQVLGGLSIFGLAYILSSELELIAVHSLLENVFANIFLIMVLIFQNEIRRGLTHLGSRSLFRDINSVEEAHISEELAKGLTYLSKKGTGAIIVVEKDIDLSPFVEGGVILDSEIRAEMIEAVFHPTSRIHDGAVWIKDGRIYGAGVFLPLSTNPALDRNLGTRHRAALGISEIADVKVFVVSEENQSIGFVEEGRLSFEKDISRLPVIIAEFLSAKKSGKKR